MTCIWPNNALGNLKETQVMRKFGNAEFSIKPTNFYNLDVILSVGYRVKSQQGILFGANPTDTLFKTALVVGTGECQLAQ